MPHFAIPVLAFIEAETIEVAQQRVADTLSIHAFAHEAHRMPCILDERLNSYQYDPSRHEPTSALDIDHARSV